MGSIENTVSTATELEAQLNSNEVHKCRAEIKLSLKSTQLVLVFESALLEICDDALHQAQVWLQKGGPVSLCNGLEMSQIAQ